VPTYGIVFSGGGALGAWEVGCYDAIKGKNGGAAPLIVTGASAGALNAVGVCAGMQPPQLEELWSSITSADVYRFRFDGWDALKIARRAIKIVLRKSIVEFLSSCDSVYDSSALSTTLTKKLSNYYPSFSQSDMYFAISLTNLTHGKREYFYKTPVGERLSDKAINDDHT